MIKFQIPVRISVQIFLFILTVTVFHACQDDERISPDTTTLTFRKLSEYEIYQGNPSDLIPTSEYKLYELSSQLFTDHAEKQRLIKLPVGARMSVTHNGLLDFPEGTIIVKTFYYFNDKRNTASGKKLIETRILQLTNGEWIAGTYLWNNSQTEADLISTGLNKTVNWIDESGSGNVISYHVPSTIECRTCHNSNKSVIPIGPKTRNLNFDVNRNTQTLNQLTHLQNEGILNNMSPSDYSSMPDYTNTAFSLETRARAYLDINCAHCHNHRGFASHIRFRMEYETDLNASKIKEGRAAIKDMMEKGSMPKIGTTVIDKQGVELIKRYLETL